MKSNRGELASIGDPALDLPDLGNKTNRDDSLQAVHHFTQADQVNQLVSQRSRSGQGFHSAADGAVKPAAYQPRQPQRVHPAQRPV